MGLSGRLIASYILVTLAVVVLVEALLLGFQVPLLRPAKAGGIYDYRGRFGATEAEADEILSLTGRSAPPGAFAPAPLVTGRVCGSPDNRV